jgi:hypothetical protein
LERARTIYEKALGPMHLVTLATAAGLTGEWRPTKEALKTQAFSGLAGDYENPAKASATTKK